MLKEDPEKRFSSKQCLSSIKTIKKQCETVTTRNETNLNIIPPALSTQVSHRPVQRLINENE